MNTQPPDLQRTPPTPFVISPEDQKIVKECNREAFFQRSLPISSVLGGLTYMAVKAGYFRASPSWGPTPKVMAAVFFGYFVGKVSYQQVCAEKLMANPNSPLGAMLRARRQQGKGGFQDSLTLDMPGYSLPSLREEKPDDVYQDDLAARPYSDLDTDRPYNQGLNDSFRQTIDSPQRPEDFVLPPQSTQPNSYEEMRRKNREEFDRKTRSFSRPVEEPPRYQPAAPPFSPDPYRPVNVYGDVFEK